MGATLTRQDSKIEQSNRVLGKARRKQLDAALSGRIMLSAHYAKLAKRVRRFIERVHNL